MPDLQTPTLCPIWGQSAFLEGGTLGDGAKIYSARTGGRYGISGTAASMVEHMTVAEKAKLTTWLVEQRSVGVKLPIVNADTLEVVKERRPLRFSEKKERFFRVANFMGLGPSVMIPITNFQGNDEEGFARLQLIAAWIEAFNLDEARAIVELLAEEGFVRISQGPTISMTSKGLDRMEELETGGADTLQAFVAMWFSDEMKEAWRTGFAPAIRDAGYDPFRIDGLEHNGKIDDAIVAEIKRSRFLIADFTCGGAETADGFEPNPRGGVYYEAGLAHGLGMEVIFTCREDRMPWLHFDTRQFAHLVWKTPDDLRVQLYNRIAATLKEAPAAPGRGRGSIDPA